MWPSSDHNATLISTKLTGEHEERTRPEFLRST
jgi:hypothetical protein